MNERLDSTAARLRSLVASSANGVALGAWAASALLFLYLATIPLDLPAQIGAAAFLSIVLVVLHVHDPRGIGRLLFLALGAFATLRYFLWRTTSTLDVSQFPDVFLALALYLAEAYGVLIFLLGLFVNARPLARQPLPLTGSPSTWPRVDVLVPSYDESKATLEITLLAAAQIRYPSSLLRIVLLDDGATVEKLEHPDPLVRDRARRRRSELETLCGRLDVQYLARERNEGAKAGNLNYGLERTDGDLVLVLDSDHVPTADILQRTVGLFQADSRLGFVQTPHFFINPNPIEKNLATFDEMPGDNEMFFRAIHPGLDFWNASYFCGSAAVIRREALAEVGGLRTETITEDADTSLDIHARGWRSAYLSEPVTCGLSPETLSGFMTQRARWAQGMVQIFRTRNPLSFRGLTLPQRLCYFNGCFFWFFSYARIIFLLAPSAYLLFGWKIFAAEPLRLATYVIPHLIAVTIVLDHLYGKFRWALVSELYELMQSLRGVGAVTRALWKPRGSPFRVTPKGETLETDEISPYSGPVYTFFAIVVITLVAAVFRYVNLPAERGMILITAAWELFNLVILLAAIGALVERRQRRHFARTRASWAAHLLGDEGAVPCLVEDVSMTGAGVQVTAVNAAGLDAMTNPRLEIWNPARGAWSAFPIRMRNRVRRGSGPEAPTFLGLEFEERNPGDLAERVSLVYGDSLRWVQLLERRERRPGVLKGAVYLTSLGFRHSIEHAGLAGHTAVRWALARLRTLRPATPAHARRNP